MPVSACAFSDRPKVIRGDDHTDRLEGHVARVRRQEVWQHRCDTLGPAAKTVHEVHRIVRSALTQTTEQGLTRTTFGTSIDAGWTYYVLTREQATALRGRATSAQLAGHPAVEPDALPAAVRRAAGSD